MLAEIERVLCWGEAIRVHTRAGERIWRQAPATPEVAALWRCDTARLYQNGYSLARKESGELSCWHWAVPSETEKDALERVREMSRAVKTDFEPPAPLGLHYYDYQKAGISFAWEQRNALIGDEMGLGKTLQGLGLANVVRSREGCRWILVATLRSLTVNWRREAQRWLTFPAEISIAKGKPPANLGQLYKTEDVRVLIITYHTLARWREVVGAVPWDVYIADEAHTMRNAKAKMSEAGLGVRARRKVFLTGTPLENRPSDIWPLIHALQPARYPTFFTFAKRYCDAKQKKVKEGRTAWDFTGASNLDELRENLRGHVMIRRLKDEVLKELPKKTRQIIELPADTGAFGEELGLFECEEDRLIAIRSAVQQAMMGDDVGAYSSAMKKLTRAAKVAFERLAAERLKTAVKKLPLVMSHLEDLIDGGAKVLCFAHHSEVIDKLRAAFKGRCAVIDGSMTGEQRQAQVDRFQTDAGVPICIASIRACGTGLNLTAANVVVFAELDWVPSIMAQCEDRAHRIGQLNPVLVHYLVLEGSLDARMAQVLAEKVEMAATALDGDEDAVSLPWTDQGVIDDATPEILAREGEAIDAYRRTAIVQALHYIAERCDHGRTTDGFGFSTVDARLGHELARLRSLTAKQAAVGLRLVRRYHRQLPESILEPAIPAPAGSPRKAEQIELFPQDERKSA